MKKYDDQIIIRVPRKLKDWVREEAEKQDRSMNYVAVRILEAAQQKLEGEVRS